ncbi:MAG TPA: respiratory nitrate reductase subunit gamma [Kofleriaceae bacterium]|nr:respiratory nitrate reductase subunit gamma [Kofleriaceae bacterium]
MIAALALGLVASSSAARAAGPAEAKKIFNQRCTACHTFGKGVKVGPDLKGVTERRTRAWLLSFIRSSQKVIESGDPTATQLFKQFKQQRMPDWSDLSEEQVGAILDWFAANGPEQKPIDERLAELARPAEIERGRALFHGEDELAGGGMACAACHSIREDGEAVGGTLARDLTTIYGEYRDRALTLFIRKPCSPRAPESSSDQFLRPDEAFAIKAYLMQTARDDRDASRGGKDARAVGKPTEWSPPRSGPGAGPATPRGRRSAASDQILFVLFPFAALLLLVAGFATRHAMARRRLDALQADARSAWQVFRGSLAWRVGLAAVVLAHLAGMIVPDAVLSWNRVPLRLYLLEGSGFAFGLLALAGWARLMWRHLGKSGPSRLARAGELADTIGLSVLFLGLGSGLLTAVLFRWSSSWAAGTLSPYIASLARAEPDTALLAQMPFLVKLHVLSLFGLMAVLPFTSAALIPLAALERLLAAGHRPMAAAIKRARAALARFSPARWIWPEEDAVDAGDDGRQLADEIASDNRQAPR